MVLRFEERWPTLSSSWLCRERSTFLSNFPTLVLGTSGINVQYSGAHHFMSMRSAMKACSASAVNVEPGFRTTHADGLSHQLASGTATTATAAHSGRANSAHSR